MVSPVDSEFGYPWLISKDSSATLANQVLSTNFLPLFLGNSFSEDIMNVVANSDELLIAVANGNDQSCDT